MANLLSPSGTNNFASAIWLTCDTTSASIAGATSANVTTANLDSAAFTPGAIGTTDGVLLNMSLRVASPSGTMTVSLITSVGSVTVASVQINNSDLPAMETSATAPGCWVFFKWTTPFVFLAATAYKIRVTSSVTTQCALYGGASNDWNRLLRLTAAAVNAAAGDRLFIQKENTGAGTSNASTVTMDKNATTSFGKIDITAATLQYSTAANTQLRTAGNMDVWAGGTLSIGTSGTPIPAGTTAILEFDCGSAVQFGLETRANSTVNVYGGSKTKSWSLLAADAAASATSLTIADSVGSAWKNGDTLAISSTTRTVGELETKAMSADGSGTTLTVAALTNAHGGNASTLVQAEVGNLNRWAIIRTVTAANPTYLVFRTTSTVNVSWAQIQNIGSNTSNKRGIDVTTTTGSCTIQHCAIWNSTAAASSIGVNVTSTTGGATIDDNVIYNLSGSGITVAATSGTNSLTNNMIATSVSNAVGIQLNDVGGTCSGNYISSINQASAGGFRIAEAGDIGTIADNVVHSCVARGIEFTGFPTSGTVSGSNIWRNGTTGIAFNNGSSFLAANCTISGGNIFGNATAGIGGIGTTPIVGTWNFDSITLDAGVTLTQPVGLDCVTNTGLPAEDFRFYSCLFGTNQAHSTGDISAARSMNVLLYNCNLASSTPVATQGNMTNPSYIRSSRDGQVAGAYRAWFKYGTIQNDTSLFHTASPSEKLTPNNTSNKLQSAYKYVALNSGQTATVSVWINKDSTYDGAQPRLIVSRQDSGITSNTVLATYSSGTGSWNQISGTTAAVTENCVLTFYVDSDKGTGGFINIDDWAITVS